MAQMINDHQRVAFVEGAQPNEDRLVITDDAAGTQIAIDHSSWAALSAAIEYFHRAHCEDC